MRAERYRVIEEIGEGYYARVVRAWDRQRGTEVAIKYAKPFEDAQMKIHHEFSILSQLKHPNILKVFDFEGWGKKPYFTSEFIPGYPITEYFRNRPLADLPFVMFQFLAGLASIHAQGYLHLDLKPDNILVIPKQSSLKILDLGFAELISERTVPAGTLGYLAPELLGQTRIDYRADLYSIGVILYHIYTGRPPFDLKSPISTLKDQLSGNIPEPIEINPKLRPRINDLIMKLLSPDPMVRPSTCHELFAEFEATFRRRRKKRKKQITLPEMSAVVFAPGIVGREDEIASFDEILPLKGKFVYALQSDIGFGKSTLVNNLGFKIQLERIENLKYIPSDGSPSLFQRFTEHLSLDVDDCKPEDRHFSYEELFKKIRENLPFALIIDDAQTLSKSDLEVLRYIVFGFRDDEQFLLLMAGEKGDWESIVESLSNACTIDLGPFDRNLIEEMLSRMFGVIINPHWLSNWIYQKTAGRPSAILDIINLAFRIGAMKHSRGGWEYDPVRLEALESPESLIEPTIDGLPDRLKFAVEALMVSSSPIPITAIYLALRGEEVDIGREFRRLWFIEEVNTPRGSAFRIRSNELRKKMADRLAKKKRSDTAALLLKAVESIYREDGKQGIFTLADLAIEAHLLRKMRVYCKKAGMVAYQSFLFERALNYFKILKDVGQDKNIDEVIGDCYWMLGEPNRALECYDQAKDTEDLLVKRSRALNSLGRFEEALDILSSVTSPGSLILIERGAVLTALGRYKEAEQALNRAISQARTNDSEDEFRAVYRLSILYSRTGDYQKAKERILDVLKSSRSLRPQFQASARIFLSQVLQRLGDQDGLEQEINRSLGIIEENGLIYLRPYVLEQLFRINHQRGDLEQASRYARELLTVKERIGDQFGVIRGLILEGVISTYRLDIKSARDFFNRGIKLAEDHQDLKAHCLHNLGWLHYQIYDLDQADRLLGEAIAIYKGIGSQGSLESSSALQAIVRVKKGDLQGAGAILKTIGDKGLDSKKAWLELLIEKGQYDKAGQVLSSALNLNPDLTDLADLRILKARLKARSGDLGGGIELVNGLVQDLTMTRHTLYYLRGLLEKVRLIIRNEGYQFLNDFKESLTRIEGIIRGKGLVAIEKEIKELKEEAFTRLVSKGMKPDISKALRKLAEAINLYMGGEGIFNEVLDILIEATSAERGIIFLRGKSDLKIAAGRNVDRQTIADAKEFSAGIIKEIDSGPVIANDALSDEAFRERRSVQLNMIRSLIAAPLIIDRKPIGAVYLDSRVTTNLFSDEHLDLLVGITPLISTLIEKSRIFKELKEEHYSRTSGLSGVFLMTDSKIMEEIYEMVDGVADSEIAVLLSGETGAGKGVIARLIHEKSRRKGKFIAVNCAVLPEPLFESELFGYKKGAFTDARQDKPGLIEEADQGTLFLDEVTAIPVSAQAKLLQVLEEGRFRRLGETTLRGCNVRLICASNHDIEEEVDSGRFRKDLLYRINTIHIKIPPLRGRPEDIESFARFFLKKVSRIEGKRIKGFTDDALEILISYPWPGNIRELNNLIQRAVILAKGEWITVSELIIDLNPREITRERLVDILRDSETISDVAKRLNIPRRKVYRLIKRYKITKKQFRS